MVVETDDAVLIADRSKAQEIKTVVKQLEAAGSQGSPPQDYRPWGHYTGVTEGTRWQVKRIQETRPACRCRCTTTAPNTGWWSKALPWWARRHRAIAGESTYIPMGCQHRLSNPGRIPVELIEVQSVNTWEKTTSFASRTVTGAVISASAPAERLLAAHTLNQVNVFKDSSNS